MPEKRIWLVELVLVASMGLLVAVAPFGRVRAQEGVNLLQNGDFEAGAGEAWPFQDGIPEVQVALGWRAFWLDQPPPYAVVPSHCAREETGCYWGRPEFRGMSRAEESMRVRSGFLAQKYFSWNRQHEAGLMQQVGGIAPGMQLLFQVHVQTWSCLPEGGWNNCPTSPLSNQPAPMHIRVGIDPTGGTNPWAETVVWSAEGNAWDSWTLFQVEANAQADSVTVFVYSRADWTDTYPRISNDVYIDDASLVVTTPPTNTPPPPPPTNTPGPSPTPRPTSTPRPDGAIVHIVQPGETLFGVALQYGVPPEQIEELNAGSLGPNSMLYVGQEYLIAIPSEPPTPTPPPATPTPESQSVCVLAYHDRNGDTFRQADTEELLPNAAFSLGDASGLVGQYTTDGLSEPHCFTDLAPGTYRVVMQPPPGYVASGPSEWALAQGAAGRLEVAFGVRQGEGSVTDVAVPSVNLPGSGGEGAAGESGSIWRVLRWVARIGGIVLLAAAAIIAVLFFLSHRSRALT